jgi:hypothetical protein
MKPPPIRDQSESSQISQSQGFFSKLLDVNGDGVITKGEAASKVQHELDKGLSTRFIA